MVNTKIKLCGIEIDNPIIPASGTFGYGKEFNEFYDINILGSFSFKGTTKDPRFGNETPRIAETEGGMLNSVGLQNPGVEKVISEELPALKKFFHKPVMANVSGFAIEDYAYTCEKLDGEEQIGWIEVNISCPNVHGGGMSFGTNAKNAAEVTKAVKRVTTKPIIIKLTPNVTDVTGGLSGPCTFPVALRCVWQVYNAVNIPIVGMGGVTTAEDVIEMMMAGATAVQVGAANLVDPYACKKIIEELPAAMEKYRISSLDEIIGIAH